MKYTAICALLMVTSVLSATSPLDPVRVAPHIYTVAFENERVRVLKKTIRNGETPPLHTHPDRVVVFLSPCAWLSEADDGSVRMQSFRFGEPIWAAAETHGGETANVVEQCRVLEIELKDQYQR